MGTLSIKGLAISSYTLSRKRKMTKTPFSDRRKHAFPDDFRQHSRYNYLQMRGLQIFGLHDSVQS
jgi:hypothetical protein